MIDYAKVKVGDKLRITGMGAKGFAELGDTVTVIKNNGTNKLSVTNDKTGDEAFFALTCGAQRLEAIQ